MELPTITIAPQSMSSLLMVPEDHFSGVARSYTQHRPVYPRRPMSVLAERAPGRPLAVHCGCGSGQLSVPLAAAFRRVIGVDASAAQIDHAAHALNVQYRVAPAERTGLPGHCADLIVAAQAVRWFDLAGFWAEVDCVARPGALVALIGYGCISVTGAVGDVLADFHDRIVYPYWPAGCRLVLEGYRSIDFPYPGVAAPRIEMTASWSLDQVVGYLATWSSVARADRVTGEPILADVADRLTGLWEDSRTTTTVHWPLFIRLGRVAHRPPPIGRSSNAGPSRPKEGAGP
jgi:hypothetical protein